jgi:hypothetical protein
MISGNGIRGNKKGRKAQGNLAIWQFGNLGIRKGSGRKAHPKMGPYDGGAGKMAI